MRICAALMLFLAAFAPALAQNPAPAASPQPSHPDFSGTWKLNRAASKVPKGAEAGPETIYIDCMGSMILMGLNGDPSDHWDTFITDGEEHFVAQTQMGATSHTAYWKRFSLITESNLYWETAGDVYPH